MVLLQQLDNQFGRLFVLIEMAEEHIHILYCCLE